MSKLLYFSALAEYSAEQLTKSREQWTAFLTTVARLYKYPYSSEYQQENPTVKKYFKKFSESGCGLSLPAAYPLRGQLLGEIRRDGWR